MHAGRVDKRSGRNVSSPKPHESNTALVPTPEQRVHLPRRLSTPVVVLIAVLAAACSTIVLPAIPGLATCSTPAPREHATPAATTADLEALYRARRDSLSRRFTDADVQFMTGMIVHHAQALVMSAMAPRNEAGPAVRTLADRIYNAQQDEIERGLDVFELVPSPFLSENEIAAAKTVRLDHFNAQSQPRFVWPPSFALAGAYVDQLARSNGLPDDRIASIRQQLARAEAAATAERQDALAKLAAELQRADDARDAAKVRLLADAVRALAAR